MISSNEQLKLSSRVSSERSNDGFIYYVKLYDKTNPDKLMYKKLGKSRSLELRMREYCRLYTVKLIKLFKCKNVDAVERDLHSLLRTIDDPIMCKEYYSPDLSDNIIFEALQNTITPSVKLNEYKFTYTISSFSIIDYARRIDNYGNAKPEIQIPMQKQCIKTHKDTLHIDANEDLCEILYLLSRDLKNIPAFMRLSYKYNKAKEFTHEALVHASDYDECGDYVFMPDIQLVESMFRDNAYYSNYNDSFAPKEALQYLIFTDSVKRINHRI